MMRSRLEASPQGDQPSSLKDKFLKTKLCRFNQSQRCRYGDTCPFAHSLDELEEQPDLRKTSLCKSWQKGHCPLSADECNFAHGKGDLNKLSVFNYNKRATLQEFLDESETTDCSSDASGMSQSGREEISRNSSFWSGESGDDASPQMLKWDPLGLTEALKGSSYQFHDVWNDITWDQPSEGTSAQKAKDLLRQAKASTADALLPGRPEAESQVLPMQSNLVLMAVGPNEFIMVPPAAMIAPMYCNPDIEALLQQSQPDHYED